MIMKDKYTKNIFRTGVFLAFLVLSMSSYAFSADDVNPLNINKTVIGVLGNQIKYVEPNEEITYRIHINNNDNDFRATNVTIVDYLPDELSFVSANYHLELGYYDEDTRTYRWGYVPLEPGDATAINLTLRVNPDVRPGTVITNNVTIYSDETPESASSVDVIVPGVANRFNLSKSVVGAVGEVHKVGSGEQVTYRICFDGNDITLPVTNVSVTDFLPQQVSFVKADGDGIIGHYDDNTRTYTWSYPFISPGEVVRLELTAKVNEGTPMGEIITNSATLYEDGITSSTATADIITDLIGIQVEDLQIDPGIIRRDDDLNEITARMKLPKGFGANNVAEESLTLSPGNIKAKEQFVNEIDGRAVITAVFDKAALLDAIAGYGYFNVEITGKLKSGQLFYGQALITITGDEDLSDYISSLNIRMNTIWDYNDPADNTDFMYEFLLEIEALVDPDFAAFNIEAYVGGIEFLTPAGEIFQIPMLPGQWSGNIWRSYEYDPEKHLARWQYKVRSENLDDLKTYGDGTYLVTAHYLNSDQDQIPVFFGVPDAQTPIPQPTQEPLLTFPEYGQEVGSPLILMWEPGTDKHITEIRIDVDEDRTEGSKGGTLDRDKTRWGPVYLTDGLWKTELAFGQWYSSDNDGISIEVGKYSKSRSEFFVIGQPASTYEVWGGERFVGLDGTGAFIAGSFKDIAQLKAYEYIKLGESKSQPATFPGEHKYYLIATRGQFLLDSIQGPNESYYSSFEPSFELYNVTQPDNLLGPPDGRCSLIGVSNPWYDFSGYFAFTNPGNWTGITVTAQNLNLSKSIVGTVDEIENIDPNDTITYKISIDSNHLIKNVTGLSIMDILPEEVSFVYAENNGVPGKYDPETHTYTWLLPSMAPQSAIEMEITVQVNPDVAQGTAITNFVFINSNEMPPATSTIEVVTREDQPPMGDVQADLQITPETIRRGGTLREFMAVLVLPEGIDGSFVVPEPLELMCDSVSIRANSNPIVTEDDGRTVVIAIFDTAALMGVVPGYGEKELSVIGKLTSGDTFYGDATITITRFADN